MAPDWVTACSSFLGLLEVGAHPAVEVAQPVAAVGLRALELVPMLGYQEWVAEVVRH
jgi:hypothetical protein